MTVSEETVERVAEAIDAARYAHPDYPRIPPDRPFSRADRHEREYARRLARAALAATPPPPADANRVMELERALKPFVAFIEKADGPLLYVVARGQMEAGPGILADAPDDHVLVKVSPECPPVIVGHFRRARAALAKQDSET